MAHKSPVDTLNDARQQRAALAASLPALTTAAAEATAHRTAVTADLDRLEGDALIGLVNDSALTKARKLAQTATDADRSASASLRKAQADLKSLDSAITRLQGDAFAIRVEHYRTEQIRLATEFHAALAVAAQINAKLDALYAEAETEFPPTVVRAPVTRGYSVAAGLTNMAWPSLRSSARGGRLDALASVIEDLRHPPKPRQRAAAPPTPPPAPKTSGVWQPLPEVQ